jgi:hypothetical protein
MSSSMHRGLCPQDHKGRVAGLGWWCTGCCAFSERFWKVEVRSDHGYICSTTKTQNRSKSPSFNLSSDQQEKGGFIIIFDDFCPDMTARQRVPKTGCIDVPRHWLVPVLKIDVKSDPSAGYRLICARTILERILVSPAVIVIVEIPVSGRGTEEADLVISIAIPITCDR